MMKKLVVVVTAMALTFAMGTMCYAGVRDDIKASDKRIAAWEDYIKEIDVQDKYHDASDIEENPLYVDSVNKLSKEVEHNAALKATLN